MKSYNMLFFILIPLLFISCGKQDINPSGSGLIEATEVVVSAEVSGQVKALYVDEGDSITAGDVIGLIDTTTIYLKLNQSLAAQQAAETSLNIADIAIEQADFNLGLAKKEYDRVEILIASGSVNQQLFDQVQVAYEQAQLTRKQADASYLASKAELTSRDSDVALLQKQLSDCYPKSPVSGYIEKRFVESGELIAAGKPLIKIAKLDTVWVKVYLPPNDLVKIKLGCQATIDSETGQAGLLNGIVSWISDQAEFTPKNVQSKEARADLVYAVKITIPNPDKLLKIGMPVMAKIDL